MRSWVLALALVAVSGATGAAQFVCSTPWATQTFSSLADMQRTVPTWAAPRTVLALNDLQWKGFYRTPDADGVGSVGGSSAYATGAVAIRYVNGERRFLIPNFARGAKGEFWGDLVEYAAPAAALYTGDTPSKAPVLIPVRRWAAPDWTRLYRDTPEWSNPQNRASGAKLGTILWDEQRHVLWYQIYGYYSAANQPFLAAVQLTDDADARGGAYRTVGASYGPWYYRSQDAGVSWWKQADYFLSPVPASAQADLGGRTLLIGGATSSVTTEGYLGPGFAASRGLPSLDDPPGTVIPLGLKIADYSPETTLPVYGARRAGTYTPVDYSQKHVSPFYPNPATTGGVGYWLGSMDRLVGFAWIETATKHGLLMYGSQATGRVSYGFNPLSHSPQNVTLRATGRTITGTVSPYPHPLSPGTPIRIDGAVPSEFNGRFVVTSTPTPTTFTFELASDPTVTAATGTIYLYGWDPAVIPDVVDPNRPVPNDTNGYVASAYVPQLVAFDPAQIREVGRGVRAPNNTGINPIALGDWHAQWPNLPYDRLVQVGAQGNRWVADNVANRLVWDPIAQELIWVATQSVSATNMRPTVNIFTVAP